ncbi:MAG: membrane protein insertase YidC [Clostridiales Family XIII bacterium]|nr:membrane protein insertase YidC [Clostridiales Family XIII bacterium]
MRWCYEVTGGYGAAIILFTVFTKVILFPLSLIAQKNSIKMVRMQPLLTDIRAYNSGDGPRIAADTKALYKKERYSTIAGILPLLLQIPIILGLIHVVYQPASQYENTIFAGIDLALVPSPGSITLIWPVLSGVSAFVLSWVQNRYNVLQVEQGFIGKWGMAIFLVAFSAYFAYAVPGALGLYWTASNLLSIPVLFLCNLIFNPKKYIDYSDTARKAKPAKEAVRASREEKRALRERERKDAARFFAEPVKQVVFYSEANGFWRYFDRIIAYIVGHSDVVVHYVTSDPDDRIFENNHPQLRAYYIGPKALTSFMMKMDADMVVMTMPDLETFHIKRSIVRKDIEYIYTDHGMDSYHMVLREHALDHFDTIFVFGPNHIEEVRETERVYGLPEKTLVKTGFVFLDSLLEQVAALGEQAHPKKRILIAPSWQMHNIMDSCLDDILSALLGHGYEVTVRPHPEFVKRFPAKMERILGKYAGRAGDELRFDTDFSSSASIYTADLVITDWSSIAQDFSYATKRPTLFINTPMKVINPAWERIPCVPLGISLRNQLGVSIDTDKLETLPDAVADLLSRSGEYKDRIAQILDYYIFDIGRGGEGGGAYIVARCRENEAGRGRKG